jgi:hypothetical protein
MGNCLKKQNNKILLNKIIFERNEILFEKFIQEKYKNSLFKNINDDTKIIKLYDNIIEFIKEEQHERIIQWLNDITNNLPNSAYVYKIYVLFDKIIFTKLDENSNEIIYNLFIRPLYDYIQEK